MKYILPILLIYLFITFLCCKDEYNISIKEIKDDQLKFFIGKKVEYFINKIREKYIEYYFIHEPPSVLRGCLFIYEDNIIVYIYSGELKYLKRINPGNKLNWNIYDFYREEIYSIEIKRQH